MWRSACLICCCPRKGSMKAATLLSHWTKSTRVQTISSSTSLSLVLMWCNMLLPSLQVNSSWTWPRLTSYPRTNQNVEVSSLEAQKYAMFYEANSYAFAWHYQKLTWSSLQHNSFCTIVSPSFWSSPSLLTVQPFKTLEVLTQELGWCHRVNATKHFCCLNNASILLSGTCCFVLSLLAWLWQLLSDRVYPKPSFLIWQTFKSFDHPHYPSLDAFQPVCMFLLHGRFQRTLLLSLSTCPTCHLSVEWAEVCSSKV